MASAATGIIAALLLTSVLALPSRRLRSDNEISTSNFVGDGTNELATAILQGYVDSEENLAFSPLGYSVLLAILKEGARGETRNQLVNALHLPEDPAVTRAAYKSVLERFREKNAENHPEFRNWFYIYKNFTVESDYRQILQENYLTEVKDVDRLDKEAVKEEAESMKNADSADSTTQPPVTMTEESGNSEELIAPASAEIDMDSDKGDKTENSGQAEEIMQLSDEEAPNSNKDGPMKFTIPIPFPEKLKLRKMHDEREPNPSGEVMTMQEEMLGNKKEEEKSDDTKKDEKVEEIKEEKKEEIKEVIQGDKIKDGNKGEKIEEIKDENMKNDEKDEKMDDGKKKEIIKEIVDEMKALRDKLTEEKDKEEKIDESNKEAMKDEKAEEIKEDEIEKIKGEKIEGMKDEKIEEIKDNMEEKKDEMMEEKKEDKMEAIKDKTEDTMEEKKDDKMEEAKDDKMEKVKDDKIQENKPEKIEKRKDDNIQDMKVEEMEGMKDDKMEVIKNDKKEEMKDDKMEAMKDEKKEHMSNGDVKDCDMMSEGSKDSMKEQESMADNKKDEIAKEDKDKKENTMMENKDKKEEDMSPGAIMEDNMKVDTMKEKVLISQAIQEYQQRGARHLSRGILWPNDVTSSLSGNNLVRKDTRSEAVSQMLVFNGLYFKGTWDTPFLGQREDSFYKSDSEKSTVTMMNTQGSFRVGNIPDLDSVAIELPYKGKRYSLMVVMPNSRTGLRQLAAEMTNYPLRDIQKHLQYQDVEVCIPSFEVESTTKPIQALNKFGVSDIFSKEQADLSGISKDSGLFVEELVQFVTVKVDNGSGSYNEMTGSNPSTRSGLTKFAADHPFLFFVRDMVDNVIVIAGKVVDPSVLPKFP